MGKSIKMMNNEIFVRVVTNELSEGEKTQFEEWLKESPENEKEFEVFLSLWEKTGKEGIPAPPESENQWKNIKEKMKKETPRYTPKTRSSLSHRRGNHVVTWFSRIAAVLVLGISFYVLHQNEPINIQQDNVIVKEETQVYERVVRKGERAEVRLADGSMVYLNSYSKLKYPKYFDGESREVELEGEGYFVIAHNADKPFRVRTGKTVTEVVGTEFNIKYRSESEMELVVFKGAVKAYEEAKSEKTSLVEKGERVIFFDNIGFSRPQKVDVYQYNAWRENKLAFTNASLEQVMNEIGLYYNINTKFEFDSLKQKRLTGIFANSSLEDIVTAVSISLNVNIENKGNTLIIN